MAKRISSARKRKTRKGVVTVEFAFYLPLMVLICFGSIQLSTSILLRHQAVAVLEAGTLDYMLGNISETDLPSHVQDLAESSGLIGVTATVTSVEPTYLRVEMDVPLRENIAFPIVVGNQTSIGSRLLIYRPPTID